MSIDGKQIPNYSYNYKATREKLMKYDNMYLESSNLMSYIFCVLTIYSLVNKKVIYVTCSINFYGNMVTNNNVI